MTHDPADTSAALAGGAPTTARPQDTAAWVLAFLPLGAALLGFAARAAGLHPGLVSAATLAGSAALVVTDKRDLARTGRLARTASPSTAWFLFPPAYLRRRARLLGEAGGRFWISLGCMALAFAVQVAVLAGTAGDGADAGAEAPILPACTDDADAQVVVDLFGKLKPMRDAGVEGVVLTDRAEVPGGELEHPPVRRCAGMMRASNEEGYAIAYVFEIVEGQVIVHVVLR